jgi:hypothetical protein
VIPCTRLRTSTSPGTYSIASGRAAHSAITSGGEPCGERSKLVFGPAREWTEIPVHPVREIHQALLSQGETGRKDLVGSVRPQVAQAGQGDVLLVRRTDRARLETALGHEKTPVGSKVCDKRPKRQDLLDGDGRLPVLALD